MDEQASFERRAVLAPRRARLTRLALLVPMVALVAIAWVGASGDRSNEANALVPEPTAAEDPTPTAPEARPRHPAQVLGINVQELDDVQPRGLDRDDVVALVGWYATTAIVNCPPLPALYRDGALPYLRGDADVLAFCQRFGVLYASSPKDDRFWNSALPAFDAALALGIIVPPELEVIGADAKEIVVLGRFVPGDCRPAPIGCRPELVVDHVAWTAGA